MEKIIEHWKSILQIEDWEITTQRIEPSQIDYDNQDYFIGIERNFKNQIAIIYHDVDLYEEAIVHELLHVKHEQLPGNTFEEYEEFICMKTDEYMGI
jgi:hypothetical protein